MAEISKTWYKLTLIAVKYIPSFIAIIYFITNILSTLGYNCVILSMLSNISLLPFICMIAFSILFKFCTYHRVPLYYAMTLNIVNYIDYYYILPVNAAFMIGIYFAITIAFINIWMILKILQKHNKTKN